MLLDAMSCAVGQPRFGVPTYLQLNQHVSPPHMRHEVIADTGLDGIELKRDKHRQTGSHEQRHRQASLCRVWLRIVLEDAIQVNQSGICSRLIPQRRYRRLLSVLGRAYLVAALADGAKVEPSGPVERHGCDSLDKKRLGMGFLTELSHHNAHSVSWRYACSNMCCSVQPTGAEQGHRGFVGFFAAQTTRANDKVFR